MQTSVLFGLLLPNHHSSINWLLSLHIVCFCSSSVEATGIEDIFSNEVLIVGGFFIFIIIVIGYHCFLKKQRRKEVMAKILDEEYGEFETLTHRGSEVSRKDVKIVAGMNVTKVNVREKKSKIKRFHMFHGTDEPMPEFV